MGERQRDETQPATVLAPPPGPSLPTALATYRDPPWQTFRDEYIHTRRGTRRVERVRIHCEDADVWSAGEAMARKAIERALIEWCATQRPIQTIRDYTFLGVAHEG